MLRTRLTLKPGRSGTRDLVEQYGSKLVCVRYRYDDELGIRYKTVELIVDEKPWIPPTEQYQATDIVHVRVDRHEWRLSEALKLLGGRYDAISDTWRIAYAATTALRITNRITPISHPPTAIDAPHPLDSDEPPRPRYNDAEDIQWRLGVGSK